MARPPVGEIRRSLRLPSGSREHAVLGLVPLDRRRVHVVPRELVQYEQRRQVRELVERGAEQLDVMENATRHDRVEPTLVVELLERDASVQRPLRRLWIDREHVISGLGEGRSHAALAPAPDLEHTGGRLG